MDTEKKTTAENALSTVVTTKRNGKPHKRKIGFTNFLAIYLVILLTIGLFMAYKLAKDSIIYNYMGQLLCFTVVFTPLGTALSLVLGKIVDKSKAENVSGDGTGIKYAQALASGFLDTESITETTTTVTGTEPPI